MSDNTILTVDVDDAGVTDFEGYFNRVVLALQDEYESMDITSHDLQLRIPVTKPTRWILMPKTCGENTCSQT